MKPTDVSNRLLMVEGDTDRQVVLRMLRRETSDFDPDEIEVIDAKGVDKLVESIRDRFEAPPFDSNPANSAVGIIVDADRDIDVIWNRIVEELRRSGVDIPCSHAPDPKGSVFRRLMPRLKVGVWIMPDNVNSGELEDFLAHMVPSGNADWPRARSYVHCSEREFGDKVKRAEVWAWIATRKEPSRFDEAIKNGDLRTDGELCQTFIAWLDRLFAVEDAAEDVA